MLGLQWTFRVDHPSFRNSRSQPRSKCFRLSEYPQVSMKGELAVMKGALERFVDELPRKTALSTATGKKKQVA